MFAFLSLRSLPDFSGTAHRALSEVLQAKRLALSVRRIGRLEWVDVSLPFRVESQSGVGAKAERLDSLYAHTCFRVLKRSEKACPGKVSPTLHARSNRELTSHSPRSFVVIINPPSS